MTLWSTASGDFSRWFLVADAQLESLKSCSWYKDKSLRRSSIWRCFSGRSVDTFGAEKNTNKSIRCKFNSKLKFWGLDMWWITLAHRMLICFRCFSSGLALSLGRDEPLFVIWWSICFLLGSSTTRAWRFSHRRINSHIWLSILPENFSTEKSFIPSLFLRWNWAVACDLVQLEAPPQSLPHPAKTESPQCLHLARREWSSPPPTWNTP